MTTIRIDNKSGQAYIPKDVRESGFTGNTELIYRDFVLLLIRPGIPLNSAVSNLKTIVKDLEQRIKHESNNKPVATVRS